MQLPPWARDRGNSFTFEAAASQYSYNDVLWFIRNIPTTYKYGGKNMFLLLCDFFEIQCNFPLELEIGGIHLHLKQRHLNAFNGTPQIFHSLAEELFLTKIARGRKCHFMEGWVGGSIICTLRGIFWKIFTSVIYLFSFVFFSANELEIIKESTNFITFCASEDENSLSLQSTILLPSACCPAS